jgi:hypothetical protein
MVDVATDQLCRPVSVLHSLDAIIEIVPNATPVDMCSKPQQRQSYGGALVPETAQARLRASS